MPVFVKGSNLILPILFLIFEKRILWGAIHSWTELNLQKTHSFVDSVIKKFQICINKICTTENLIKNWIYVPEQSECSKANSTSNDCAFLFCTLADVHIVLAQSEILIRNCRITINNKTFKNIEHTFAYKCLHLLYKKFFKNIIGANWTFL